MHNRKLENLELISIQLTVDSAVFLSVYQQCVILSWVPVCDFAQDDAFREDLLLLRFPLKNPLDRPCMPVLKNCQLSTVNCPLSKIPLLAAVSMGARIIPAIPHSR